MGSPIVCGANTGQLHIYSSAIAVSPVIAVDKLDSNWATAGRGTYAQAKARAGIEYHINNTWSFGAEKRLDYLLHFSEQTAQFYKKLENTGLAQGSYPLWLTVNAVTSRSFFTQYFIPLSHGLGLKITGHVLQPEQVQYGLFTGVGSVAEDGEPSYHFDLNYSYDENKLVNGSNLTVSGWGHSFDLQLLAELQDGINMQATWQDVWHRFYWSAINHDHGCLAKIGIVNEADCTVKESRIIQTQVLPVSSEFHLEKSFKSGLSVYGRLNQWARYDSVLLGIKQSGVNLGLDILNHAIHLSYESDMVRLKLASDQLALSNSKYLQVSLDINWPIL